MSGVWGFVGVAAESPLDTLLSMGAQTDPTACKHAFGPDHALAISGSRAACALLARRGRIVALYGHPFWSDGQARISDAGLVAERMLDTFAERGVQALGMLHGDYAAAMLEPARGYALLAVDRMSVRNIVYATTRDGLVFGPSTDEVARFPGMRRDVDPQAIFNYLYFHMVPGPQTIVRDWHRVPPGHVVEFSDGRARLHAHWRATFAENEPRDFAALKEAFRARLEDGVRTAVDGAPCGAFLSGGTDSSTIAGLIGQVTRTPARTFSIGFDAAGYDEMDYARIAARHFGTQQHEYYVTPQDVVAAIPRIAQAYDQPFGNASAVPTYYCARFAGQHGVTRMLGGDGGDELFGGNARYARQHVFARYEAIPAPLRRWLVEPLARRLPAPAGVPLLRKATSYVAQAARPMPDRYDSYNLLERLGVATILEPDFLASVEPHAPLRRLREVWNAASASSLINRMLALDFQFTLADNDLPKVTRMSELAGVDVAFPMLHDPVIDFSLALAPDYKLRGTTLRWFFKEALADFLPAQIRTKEKHGFGLPVGAWLQSHSPLRELAADSLSSLAHRGIVRPAFMQRLVTEHLPEHPGYYGTMIWILMMLELWFRRPVLR
jgi:asparagine synthase (glutamine-hydrolysing)